MKKIYSILLSAAVSASVLFTACDPSDFGDINKDPNNPSTPFTNYLFTQACTYVPYFVLGNTTNGYDPWMQEWAGYLSESKNNQYGPLTTTAQYSTTGTIYLYALRNLNQIIELNENESTKDQSNVGIFGTTANQIAVAKTLSAYYYMSLTDIIGPIVLSQAFQGKSDDNWKPEYDSQESVYSQLDEILTSAYAQFDETGTLSSAADILYGGDIAKWKKFNASLRMLLAIKLSDVAPEVGKARFAAAYANGGMTDVADGFNYTYDDITPNRLYYWVSPDYSGAGFNQVPNMFIVEAMKELKDNRMWAYFDIEGYRGTRDPEIFPRDQYTSFYGVPFGLTSNDAVNAWTDCCSSVNSKLIAINATIPVIPTARVLFTEAEAAFRGWISADAKTLYEAGINASFQQWGVDGAASYISKPEVAYNAANGLELIATQRWIASYLSDGVEAWSDWRRLDIPKMPVGPGASDNGNSHYPYRLGYYSDYDIAYNYDNYVKAVAMLTGGEDDVNSRLWWDVAANSEGVLTAEQCTPSVVIPAKWEAVTTGTLNYEDAIYQGAPVWTGTVAATLYEDVNHPGTYKIAPFGDSELVFTESGDEFVVANQIVGTVDGVPINVADFNVDQERSEEGVCYYDTDDEAYHFLLIMRTGGPRGGGSTGIAFYGYVAFTPASE
ncbi:MAG: SusD/RagB family nutrient-binding outer membrane lipoprotein [Bacteroidales bacterium]|nr:SusD/RagB family nutrient-binding outer membrane lipoprotein [Bacteroidales bacterium]